MAGRQVQFTLKRVYHHLRFKILSFLVPSKEHKSLFNVENNIIKSTKVSVRLKGLLLPVVGAHTVDLGAVKAVPIWEQRWHGVEY